MKDGEAAYATHARQTAAMQGRPQGLRSEGNGHGSVAGENTGGEYEPENAPLAGMPDSTGESLVTEVREHLRTCGHPCSRFELLLKFNVLDEAWSEIDAELTQDPEVRRFEHEDDTWYAIDPRKSDR